MGYYANQMVVELLGKLANKIKEKKAAKRGGQKQKINSHASGGPVGKESQEGHK